MVAYIFNYSQKLEDDLKNDGIEYHLFGYSILAIFTKEEDFSYYKLKSLSNRTKTYIDERHIDLLKKYKPSNKEVHTIAIWDNNIITSIGEILPSLERTIDDLFISNCGNFSCMGNLKDIGKDVWIYKCPQFTHIPLLKKVNGSIEILSCNRFSGFNDEMEVGSYIKVDRFTTANRVYIPEHLKDKVIDV